MEICPEKDKVTQRHCHIKDILSKYRVAFFDGASSFKACGNGAFIVKKPGHFFHFC